LRKKEDDMRIKLTIMSLLFVLAAGAAWGQGGVLEGKVLDANTKEPIAYAQLRIEGSGAGTQTNQDGEYSLKLSRQAARVVVSYFGYRSDTLDIKTLRKHSTVRLKPLTVNLSSMEVNDFRKPSSLLKEVVRRIPENYWTDTTVGTYFFRRYSLTSDSLWLFCEAIADVMRPGYDKQYYKKRKLLEIDLNGEFDSIKHAGNHKTYPLSRMLVFDTAMLMRMLGDSNYHQNPFVGASQTEYTDRTAFFDMLQSTQGNRWLSGKRSRRIDRRSTMRTYDDEQGNTFYLITQVTDNDSTSIVIDWKDKALVHFYQTSLHADTIMLPFPLNRIVGGVWSPYSRLQYDYAKINGRYTLVFSMSANAYGVMEPKKSLIGRKVNRQLREMITDDVVENYSMWTLVDFQPADHRFLDTTATFPVRFDAPYNEVFGQGDPGDEFWQGYNTVPIEARIAQKLKDARPYIPPKQDE
jgi:hypothetical protein